MTRAKDISKIITDADLSGTLDVTGTVTAGGLDIQGDGTISGGSRLTISDIADENNDGIRLDDNTTSRYNNLTQDTSGNFKIQHYTGSAWQNNLTVTTTGNVGIGVTPEAWDSAFSALQVGGTGALRSDASADATDTVGVSQNAYYDSANSRWEYLVTDEASDYYQQSGTHNWRVAPSGSADAAISWTNAMTINNSGNVGIGTSSMTSKFEVAVSDNTTTQEAITIKGTQGGAYGGYLGWKDNWSGDSYTGYRGAIIADVPSANSGRLRFFTANSSTLSEKMRIDASGNVGIGTSSPNEKLTVSSGAISFLGDISTPSIGAGLFRPANNTLAVVTGSTERMRINSAGSVSIGTSSSPNNAPLLIKCATDDNIRIKQETHASIQAVNDAANAFTELKLDGSSLLLNSQSGGNVGIGTSSPSSFNLLADNLVVGTTSGENGITIASGSSNSGRFVFSDNTTSSAAAFVGAIEYAHSSDSMFFYTSGSQRMSINANGYLTQSKLPMFNIIGGAHTIAATGQTTITSSNGFSSSLEYDPDSLFDHSNGRFTAPVAGRYFFIFSIGVTFTSGYHYSYLFKNGANITGLNRNVAQDTQFQTVSIQAVLNLASGDYITAERNNNNISGSVDGAMFCGFLLG